MEITATDWLEMEFIKLEQTIGVNHKMYELLEQAEIMDEQNIINAVNETMQEMNSYESFRTFKNGEQYYNETFKQK